MTVNFNFSPFTYHLFSIPYGDKKTLISTIESFYTFRPTKAVLELTDDLITIDIENAKVESDFKNYNLAISLHDQGNLEKAVEAMRSFLDKSHSSTEYFRIFGQAFSEFGNQEEAINSMIDVLKWKYKNRDAMSNLECLYSKFQGDIDRAEKYYNQIIELTSEDYLTSNNINTFYTDTSSLEKAIDYFKYTKKSNPTDPTSYMGLAILEINNNNLNKAYEILTELFKCHNENSLLLDKAIRLSLEITRELAWDYDATELIKKRVYDLSKLISNCIHIIHIGHLDTTANLHLTESNTVIYYNNSDPFKAYLILHGLEHLQLMVDTELDNKYSVFKLSTNKALRFMKNYNPSVSELSPKPFHLQDEFLYDLFDELNKLMYHTPINLFIDKRIFDNYHEIRPFQFASFYNLIQKGICATTDKDRIKRMPKSILSKFKILHIVTALQFRSLYNIDLVYLFKDSKQEVTQAETFYKEFLNYNEGNPPTAKFEFIKQWAKVLDFDQYLDLVSEKICLDKEKSWDQIVSEIEASPLDLRSFSPSQPYFRQE